jgi:hypothetical protein
VKGRIFLEFIRAKSASKLMAQMTGEILMLVPEISDCFRATIGALRSHGAGKGVSSYTFSLPEDRCIRLLLKNLDKRMPEGEMKEKLEALHVNVQAVMQNRSTRRDQDRHLTLHFIVSEARGLGVVKVRYRSVRPASKDGDVQSSKRAAPMQALPALRAYAA